MKGMKETHPPRPSQAPAPRKLWGKNKMIIVPSHQVLDDLLPSIAKRTDHQDWLLFVPQSSTVAHLCPYRHFKMKCLLHISQISVPEVGRNLPCSSPPLPDDSSSLKLPGKFCHQTPPSTIPSHSNHLQPPGSTCFIPWGLYPSTLSNTTPVLSFGYLKTHVHDPSNTLSLLVL